MAPTQHGHRPPPTRRRRLGARAVPLLLVAVASLVAGIVVGSRHQPPERRVAMRFLTAWTHGDVASMHALLAPSSQGRYSLKRFTAAYRSAAATATLDHVAMAGKLRHRGDVWEAPMQARTRVFGVLRGTVRVQVATEDEATGVVWDRTLLFPGLRAGESLRRTVTMPPRAAIQARDGIALADGPLRSSEVPTLAANVIGAMGPIPPERAAEFQALGYPRDAKVGLTGLERQFEQRLAGTFGGTLRAGGRLLASARSREAGAVRTSLDVDVEQAAINALGGRYGGVAVLRPRTGEVLALAGVAYSAPQPPGSTFKIITLAGALDAKLVKARAKFPYETFTTLSGVKLENANGESCGGTLELAFAQSCNSVFAPLGARLGAERLVAAARRFGFDEPSDIAGAPPGSIPAEDEIGDDLAVGSSAIGQGRVTATPLRMAQVAAAIANRGMLVRPTLLRGAHGRASRATSPATARTINRFMRSVVQGGTGAAAAIPGIAVAGKTGTAELRSTVPPPNASPIPGATPVPEDDTTDTDAWFVCFAPARHPRVAVAVLLVGQGAGGATAAPAARIVLDAAL